MRKEEVKKLIIEALETGAYFSCHECYWDINSCPFAKLGELFGIKCEKKVFDYEKLVNKLEKIIDIKIPRDLSRGDKHEYRGEDEGQATGY